VSGDDLEIYHASILTADPPTPRLRRDKLRG
jgi:hypothetical protein